VPALVAFTFLGVMVCAAIAAPLLPLLDPLAQSLDARLAPPVWAGGSPVHPLGTDQFGRDVLSRLVFGARISLLIGVTAVLIAGVLGTTAGVLAGFYGGLTDEILMRLGDVQLALPFILLVIVAVLVFGPSLTDIIVILGLTGWVPYARVVRGSVLSLREREFVVAARAVGAAEGRVLTRHILPFAVTSATVIGSLELANVILAESGLSFLGLGVQPPTPSWGNMLGESRNYLMSHFWLATLPGLAIAMTAVSINIGGDWLADILDPSLER
jgi:peptide/nickel transport system permease protein